MADNEPFGGLFCHGTFFDWCGKVKFEAVEKWCCEWQCERCLTVEDVGSFFLLMDVGLECFEMRR